MEGFKLHIQDKSHLSDDIIIVQLKMHLVGSERPEFAGENVRNSKNSPANPA